MLRVLILLIVVAAMIVLVLLGVTPEVAGGVVAATGLAACEIATRLLRAEPKTVAP